MAESIRAVYGNRFDGEEYLERFFDVYFSLPKVDRKKFIISTLDSTNIGQRIYHPWVKEAFVTLLDAYDLNLREIAKAIHRLRLVHLSLGSPTDLESDIVAMLMIYKSLNDVWFGDLIQGRPDYTQFRNNLANVIPRENAQIRTTRSFAFYETIMTATIMQQNGERSGAASLVEAVMVEKSVRPTEKLMVQGTLENFAHAVLNGLTSSPRIDIEELIRKIELTSGDRDVGSDV